MSKEIKIVENYWNNIATEFDAIYTGNKNSFLKLIDKIFRKDMYQRFNFTIKRSEPIKNRTFLDVGCGTGRFCIQYAKLNAKKVIGIDIAQNMIDFSINLTKKENVNNVCSFLRIDILDFNPAEKFDVSIAIGVFDYIRDPYLRIKRMKELTKDKIIVTFPRRNTWRALIRKIRLNLKGCPVYFFSKKQIRNILKKAGFNDIFIGKVGKIYCVVAK